MNREIKFRVWEVATKRMIYFNAYERFGFIQHHLDRTTRSCHGSDQILLSTNPEYFQWLEYVGLKDKNLKEIYEGDIVKVFYQFEMPCDDRKDFEVITGENIGTISFGSASFIFKNHLTREQLIDHRKAFPDSDTDITSTLDSYQSIEVLGNIYENPELLKP